MEIRDKIEIIKGERLVTRLPDTGDRRDHCNELKFSKEQTFFDRSVSVKVLLSLSFIFSLFAVLHFREVRVEMFELHSIAPGYVVAQVDFTFLDEEATAIFKREAVRDIGTIYEISENEIRKRRNTFENYFIHEEEGRKLLDKNGEEIYEGADRIEKALNQLRLTDPRTLQKIKEAGFPLNAYQLFSPGNQDEGVVLPRAVWEHVRQLAFSDREFNPQTEQFLLQYFASKKWTLRSDIAARSQLERKIQAQVPDRFTQVSAGNRIIDRGEKVTSRHIAMLQAMKKAISDKRNLWHPATLLGSLLMTLLLTFVIVEYMRRNFMDVLQSNRKLFLVITVVLLTFAISKFTEFMLLSSKSNMIEVVRYPLFIPFPAILLTSLISPAVAIFVSGFLVLVLTITLSFDTQGFMLVNIIASMVAILNTHSLKKRKEIFIVCFKAQIAAILVIFSLNFYQDSLWVVGTLTDVLSTVVFMTLTAFLVIGLLPLFETAFGVMTDVTLMEYMDPHNDLLRRLSIEAPGTYQHSIVVGNLAEVAALSIGANGLFCRVSTLYHDIGKMTTPQYFTENQQGDVNIHQLLTPEESAQVIIAHVSEGVQMARKAGLPEQFIDIIKEHHGSTLVFYFYHKHLEKLGKEGRLVEEKNFRYLGPKPRSKESAIIMIADSLEAASRSLDEINEENVRELLNRLVKEKADDGQFDECLLTFEELAVIKETLIKTLVAYRHSRIKYPKKFKPYDEERGAIAVES